MCISISHGHFGPSHAKKVGSYPPEVYIRNGLLKDVHFAAQYELYETIQTDIYASRGLLVFRRK